MGIKNTRSRKVIYSELKKAPKPLTAEDITYRIRKEKINLSTIYRTLKTFTDNGIVKKEISSIDKKAYYSLVCKTHYHILECTNCHKEIRIDYCPYESIEKELFNTYGFKIDDEHSLIYGICKECQNNN